MASRRDQIRMTDEELRAFVEEQRIVHVATIGHRGRPHLVPLWYVSRGAQLAGWTYAVSQKARNLERDPRATLMVEASTEYAELRGVMMKCDVTVHRDTPLVAELGVELFARYRGIAPGELEDDVRAVVLAQAPKLVALQFGASSRATWDHRKLAAGVV